jgi:hypothetical protein
MQLPTIEIHNHCRVHILSILPMLIIWENISSLSKLMVPSPVHRHCSPVTYEVMEVDALLPAKEELLSEKDPSPDSIVVEACVAARAASMGPKRGGELRMGAESGSTSRIAVGDVAVMVTGVDGVLRFPCC